MKKNNSTKKSISSPARFIALIPPIASLVVLLINIFILNVLPGKFLVIIIVGIIIMLGLIIGFILTRRLILQIIGFLFALVTTITAVVGSVILINTNSVISTFAENNVVITDQTGTANISNTPFILLVNGLDAGAVQDFNSRANTDVNQMVVVNPNTHQILIVNTPRDYYVYVHGITEMRDKLTHAGYYGEEVSRQTLEDLYDVNIDYYVRINFNTLVDIVDLIGGIDVESDFEFNTSSGTHVKKGWNHFNGKQALAYSRERKYFGDGDITRASDQQQVMIAIFEKISHNSELLTNFNEILSALAGSFQTDINIADLKELVKNQLDTMPTWDIRTTAVTGTSMLTTEVYSLDRVNKYYVVVPDETSVASAREDILSVLDAQ